MCKPVYTYKIEIKGLVQGVGFRPFIYRLALDCGLHGTVENRNDGVGIMINATDSQLAEFVGKIKDTAPPASFIESVIFDKTMPQPFNAFEIVKSKTVSDSITDVSPDIAVCDACLADMEKQANRMAYPFINCTNCGPRFTIIKDLPYDRALTSMQPFVMCNNCKAEYTNILDRRFHAQPVACSLCGPHYSLHLKSERIDNQAVIVGKVAEMIDDGNIVAIKGMGGYFIACDALNENVVSRLRQTKKREGKPFAVMFKDLEALKEYAHVNQTEEASLVSFRRLIVLIDKYNDLAPSVTLGFNTLGAMLPYMPVHYLLFRGLKTPVIVLTSGNISDEPIIIDNDTAIEKLLDITDAILTYNRDIHNRTDDSVVRIMNAKERVLRRSRGYVPAPIIVDASVDGILATGAELVNCFAIGRENKAFLSQHIGDLKNLETYEFYTESLARFQKLFRFTPRLVVSDLHPDYLSTRFAENLGVQHLKVQHHHAHIVSCMAEHKIHEHVIGVAFDGTGYGTDGHIWGSEFLVCDMKTFERITHFEYIPMPGGDKVTDEPWRTAVSYLYKYFGEDFTEMNLPFLTEIPKDNVSFLCHAMANNINSPLSCSAGRLFDAVAALIGLCTHARFHAEAPMRLEAVVENGVKTAYPVELNLTISFRKTFKAIIEDLQNNVPIGLISAKFHNTIVELIAYVAIDIRQKYGLNKVALSGGSFQNKYLIENVENMLKKRKFEVYAHLKVPPNDAGIALGQMALGAAYLKTCNKSES